MAGVNGDVLRELVLPRLEAVKKTGSGFMARCPAHDDGRASLSVASGKDQPVVLHCHAGCSPDDILAAVNLTFADLSKPREERRDDGPIEIRYRYVDEQGSLLFEVVRRPGKKFLQRVPDPAASGGWRWRLGDTRRVLYRLPEVVEAVNAGEVIWVTEGEKDADRLAREGITATCNPGGAGKWRDEFSEVLRGAIVMVVADADEPGQAHARQVAASLNGIAASVAICEAAIGKDISDHLNAGKTLAEVEITFDSAEPAKVDLAPDLHEFLSVVDPPQDWVIPGLLERGDRLIWTGFEGMGKSMALRQISVAVAAGLHPFLRERFEPRRVLFIDCENSERQSRRHFRKLAQVAQHKGRRVPDGGMRLIHRPQGIDLTADDATWLVERVTAHQPDLLVIGPFYRLHAADTNEEGAARKVVQALDAARTKVDCSLIVEAHAGHGNGIKGRSVRPFGSSLFLRWPEFGYGIAPDPPDQWPPRFFQVQPWRGPRDERRWPRKLQWNVADDTDWPWLDASSPHLHAIPDYEEEA